MWALVKVPGEEGYRIECLQLTDQTRNMVVLHRISNIVHNQMVKEAREVLLKKGG